MVNRTESWLDALGVGNGGEPFWCILLDIVIKNSSVDHSGVLLISNYNLYPINIIS
jgi:hypothetical protein